MNISQFTSVINQPLNWYWTHLDPIKDARHLDKHALVRKLASSSKRFNFHFLVPLSILLVNYSFGNIGLEYLHRGTFELHSWLQSPYPMDHQMFPREMWKHGSISIVICSFTIVIVFVSFTINPLDESILYYIVGENALWARGIGLYFTLE